MTNGKPSWKGVMFILIVIIVAILLPFLYTRNTQKIGFITYPHYPEPEGLKVKIKDPPFNLLLITVDTLRTDYLGINGYDYNSSPTIDQLVKEGLYFSKAITPIPRTSQALASMLTGRYPYQTGVRTLYDSLPISMVTLTDILKKAGYTTIAVVTNWILYPKRRLDKGFDVYDFANDKRDAAGTTKAAIKHLKKLSGEKPFFLWVHYIDPHVPYYPPKELAKRFDPEYKGKYQMYFGMIPGGIGEAAYPKDLGKERAVFHNPLSDRVNQHIRRLYAADIRHTDDNIGRLLKTVKKHAGNKLIIILTADHGESLGEHEYFYDHGDYVYHVGLRIPLVFVLSSNHPYNQVGIVEEWVSLVSLLPTTLDLLGIEVQSNHLDNIEGISLLPYFEGKSINPRPLFAECGKAFFPQSVKRRVKFDISGRFRSVTFDRWHLIVTPFQKEDLAYELYDLILDPYETKNVYHPNHPAAAILKGYSDQWVKKDTPEVDETIPSQEDLEALRSLGYIR